MSTPRRDRSRMIVAAIALAAPLACTGGDDDGGFSQTSLAGDTTTTGPGDGGDGDPTTTGSPNCGDGQVDSNEQCDLGSENSDAGQCTSQCTIATCGDSFLFEGFEECDDGNLQSNDDCTSQCNIAVCGDGFVQSGVEACDDANDDETDGCTSACLPTFCGDGVIQDTEQCDDGNMITTDDCPACQFAFCGDGFLQAAVEICDDGNTDPNDGCTAPLCTLATCGDGIVWEGMETCDDANFIDTDDCPTTCEPAFCGDGLLHLGVEECDDANMVDDDFCQNGCLSNGMFDNFETNDLTVFPWELSGSGEWATSEVMPHEGLYVAQSGSITHSQQTYLDVDVFAPSEGVVQFWYRVSSENCCDRLRFYVDDFEIDDWGGNVGWTLAEFPLTDGQHTLRWAYTKDGSVHTGDDAAWIDEVYIGTAPP